VYVFRLFVVDIDDGGGPARGNEQALYQSVGKWGTPPELDEAGEKRETCFKHVRIRQERGETVGGVGG